MQAATTSHVGRTGFDCPAEQSSRYDWRVCDLIVDERRSQGPGGTADSSPPLQWRVVSCDHARAVGTPETESRLRFTQR